MDENGDPIIEYVPVATGRTMPYTGSGIYVAVLDTGLTKNWTSYFPAERIATEYAISFGGGGSENANVSEQPNKWEHDTDSHGTHVTSTILGYDFYGDAVNGVAGMGYPGAYEPVISVAAPGSWIVGPYQVNEGQLSYYYQGGTSMASPHVAGVVALMLQMAPSLDAFTTEALLESAAIPFEGGDMSRVITGPNGTEVVECGDDATGAVLITADAALVAVANQ